MSVMTGSVNNAHNAEVVEIAKLAAAQDESEISLSEWHAPII